MTCWLWFHKWGKWSEWKEMTVTKYDGRQIPTIRQERECLVCGKKEFSK